MKHYLKLIFTRFWEYKYLISIGFFLVWMVFFDKQNFFYQQKLDKELEALEKDTLFYSEEILKATEKLDELKDSRQALEKMAREKYMMKKDDEEVYIIVADNPQNE